jgi:hypothetical protein
MERIDLFTGSKRSKDKRMVQLKERSGSMHPATLVIGKTTRRTVLVYSSTKTATSTRDCGKETNATVRGRTGGMSQANSGENTPVIGSRTRNMVAAPSSTKMEIVTMATGLPGCLRVRAV